jgi:hypothetical protein
MQLHRLAATYSRDVELDFCFTCHGLWFDHLESRQLTPDSIVSVFRELHRHQDAPRQPLAGRLQCPTCRQTLVQGFDVVRSGRFITHRCPRQHGRFNTFAAFMIEKGFVRQLTRPEIADIAAKVGVIHCSACGAPVDLRREDACSHCRSALSLLDPQAVEQALDRYHRTPGANALPATAVADALVTLARERAQAERAAGRLAGAPASGAGLAVDLMAVGLSLLGRLWDD